MNLLKNNKGYTLLITLAVLVLFTVLGMTILALASSGTKKNVIRQETIQAKALSEKGIDQISAQINQDLINELGENGLPRGEFISKLEMTLGNYICSNMKEEQTSVTGKFSACIESYVDSRDDKGEPNELRKLVTFSSIGNSGQAENMLASKIEIGAESVPETLKYAIGTNIMSKKPQNGEGNLLMHGGVDIQGDIKVDGNLLTRDYGYAYLNGEKWIESFAPSTKPTLGSKTAKVVLGKGSYKLNNTPNRYADHLNITDYPNNNMYSKRANIKDLFRPGFQPQVVKREPVRSPIGISDQKEVFKYERNDFGVEVLSLNSNRIIQSQNMPNAKVFPAYTYQERRLVSCGFLCFKYEYYDTFSDVGKYTLKGTNMFKQFSTLGDLDIKDNRSDVTFKEGLYVEGDLYIGNGESRSYNPKDYADITMDGPIFVNGNVTIKGANLSSNALLYVNGNVDIQYSTMKGKPLKERKTGSFIIFAKGNIKISNNSVNQKDPSEIKGFFYSEQDMEIFGVGSNIRIEGGISARRIVLNAVRGNAYANNTFDSKSNQSNKDSRLQIIYDSEIVTTFSDLRQQEPIIYNIDQPKIKEREIE